MEDPNNILIIFGVVVGSLLLLKAWTTFVFILKLRSNIFFERVDDWFEDRSWMAMAYYDYPRGQRVMVMFPFHYAVRFVWWLNYLWNRYRHKESWIDKLVKERYNRKKGTYE